MQDINLLQSKLKDKSETWDRRNNVIIVVFVIITLVVLAAGGFLYFLNQNAKKKTADLKTQNTSIQTKLDSSQGDLAEARGFQAQVQNIELLLNNHIYWTPVFDEIQKTVLKEAYYANMQATTDGKMHLEGITGSFEQVGKLILSLSTSPNLKNVKLLAIQQNSGQQSGFRFGIDLEANTQLLKK